jgi:hypothetical protein
MFDVMVLDSISIVVCFVLESETWRKSRSYPVLGFD